MKPTSALKLNVFGDEEGYSLATHCFWCGRRFRHGEEPSITEIRRGQRHLYHPRCFEKRRRDKSIDGPFEVRLG